jgi:exodeoxyribonuclease VII small subunit
MEKTFEASLAELEKIVQQLEDGDLPLEASLKLFEDGVKLSRLCRERLTQAERRIEVLMKDTDGNIMVGDLESGQTSGKRVIFDDDDNEDDDTPF